MHAANPVERLDNYLYNDKPRGFAMFEQYRKGRFYPLFVAFARYFTGGKNPNYVEDDHGLF